MQSWNFQKFTRNLKTALPAMVLAAFVCGYWMRGTLPHRGAASDGHAKMDEPNATRLLEQAVYVCPMMCVPPMEKPGECPVCGMELLPVSGGADDQDPTQLKLSSQAIALAAIQVAPAQRRPVSAQVKLFGKVDYDPAHMSYITSFMPGVIDRVYVKRAGQFVRWGDPLFDIYSSDLLATQQQLIEALKYVPSFLAFQDGEPHVARDAPIQDRSASADPSRRSPEVESALQTVAAVRHKLSILGLPKRDIDELMKVGEPTGIATVYSPMYGQVIEQKAFEGMYVNTGAPILAIGDPRYVWIKLDAYESDYPWLRKGQEVLFKTDAYPGESFTGKVVYIDPVFNAETRTFTIGVITPDRGGALKSGMLVRSIIHAQLDAAGKVGGDGAAAEQAPLVIPASAPLITGKRALVYVARPDQEGVFEGREVTLGPKADDHYVVLAGLKEGEQVVVNGNFKIDSAVQILARPSMMSIEGGHAATAHQHSGGAQPMHEDYWKERLDSRLRAAPDPRQADREAVPHSWQEEASHPEGPGRTAPTIERRRPGGYGDSTRPIPLPRAR